MKSWKGDTMNQSECSKSQLLLSRRKLLACLGSAAVVATLPDRARAAEGNLVVSNWGGDYNERIVRIVEKPLVESKGISITHDLGMEPERKAKLIAERRLKRGSIDVIHLNDSDSFEIYHQDVLADLDLSKIPNYVDVVAPLKRPYFVPFIYAGVSIIYNKDKVKNPPRSYEDLWDKRWAGKIGLTNQLYFNYIQMAAVTRGGKVTDGELGKERLLKLKELVRPRIYAAHQQLGAGLATGEVEIAVNYKGRGLQWANDGTPLAVQYPGEGAITSIFGACIPKRAPNPDAANVYLNAMLDRKAMADLAAASFYAPANSAAELSPELRAKIDFTTEEQKAMKFPDYQYVASNTAEWLEWWNKSMAR
jgi:putative spermidine/putrescine transport system substrate-binding protein